MVTRLDPSDDKTGIRNCPARSALVLILVLCVPLSGCTSQSSDCDPVDATCNPLALYFLYRLFSPTDVEGLRLWLSAEDLSLVNGAAVAAWGDASGSGNDVSQATTTNQPAYVTGAINGNPAVRFDGTDDFLAGVPTDMPVGDQGYTIIAVVKRTGSVALFPNVLSIGTNVADQAYGVFYDTSGSLSTGAKLGDKAIGVSTATLNQALVVSGTYQGSNGDYTIHVNEVLDGSATEGTPLPSWGTTALRVGDDIGGAQNLGADIGAVLLYRRALGKNERSLVEIYLSQRFGI